jgi:hypothetical protein
MFQGSEAIPPQIDRQALAPLVVEAEDEHGLLDRGRFGGGLDVVKLERKAARSHTLRLPPPPGVRAHHARVTGLVESARRIGMKARRPPRDW